MPGRPSLQPSLLALLLAALVAGCSGEGLPSLSLPTSQATAPASTASLPGGTTADTPGYNPFSEAPPAAVGRREVIANPSLDEVLKAGELPEMALGRADAPVTIVQYASMTCPYCRQFQRDTFPVLKREYIDTGKVRYILREFPIGHQSGVATIALRCAPAGQAFRSLRQADGAAAELGEPGGTPRPHLQGGGTGGDDARAV